MLVEPGFQFRNFGGCQTMLGRHVAKVNEDANRMGMDGEQRIPGPVRAVAFGAEAQGQGRSVVRRGFTLGKVKAREGLLGDVLADGSGQERIVDEIAPGGMNGERAG